MHVAAKPGPAMPCIVRIGVCWQEFHPEVASWLLYCHTNQLHQIPFKRPQVGRMRSVLVFALLIVVFCCGCHAWLIGPKQLMAGRFRLKATMSALSTGDLENVAITRIDSSEDNSFGKFRINGIVTKREMNSFIREYKEEMKRKGVIIPGFRPGNVPPHAMQEIREFVVSHALETLLGEMCNVNGLMICDQEKKPIEIGDDATLTSIIVLDPDGRNFIAQREAWGEGSDLPFTAEFFATIDSETAEDSDSDVDTDKVIEGNVIDTEEVSVDTV